MPGSELHTRYKRPTEYYFLTLVTTSTKLTYSIGQQALMASELSIISVAMSEDPIEWAGGGTNLFQYVNDNPTNLTDPTGFGWWSCIKS